MESKTEVFMSWLTKEEMNSLDAEKQNVEMKLTELQSNLQASETKYSELSTLFSEAQTELNKIYIEEKQEILEELFADFDKDLTEVEDYINLKSKAIEMELDEVESKCVYLLGLKNRSKSTKTRQPKVGKFSMVGVNPDDNDSKATIQNNKHDKAVQMYGDAAKYLTKN